MKSVLDIVAEAHLSLIEEYERKQHCNISDSQMKEFIIELSDSYVDLYNQMIGKTVDLDDVRYQAAYLFQYFTALCHSVGYGIKMLDFWQSYMSRPAFGSVMLNIADGKMKTINVCSIGGGPGTDVLGLHIYLQSFLRNNRINENVFINATVIDKHENWKLSWDAICKHLERIDNQHINIAYNGYDVSTPVPEEVSSSLKKVDVILLLKFLSSVKGLPHFKDNLKTILCSAPTGSYLIYGDNLKGSNNEIFARIAEEAGFGIIEAGGQMEFRPFNETSFTMKDLECRYGRSYQRKLSMYFMLMKKKMTQTDQKQELSKYPKMAGSY